MINRLIILLSILVPFNSFAQDYSGMYPGSMHFYSINGGNQINSIREDTSYYLGNELTKIFERNIREVWLENLTDTSCFEVGGICELKKDGSSLLGVSTKSKQDRMHHTTAFNDSLIVNFNVSVADTQLVFQNVNNEISYVCLSRDSITLFGISDSLIKFKIIHLDSLGNLVNSSGQGDTIIYSKNLGLYKGFALDSFPYIFKKIQLEGIRNPNYGFDGLKVAEFYDYQINDQFEFSFNAGPYSYNEFLEVLNRIDSVNNVTYLLNRVYETRNWNFTLNHYDTNQTTSIVQRSYSKQNYLDEFDYNYRGYRKNQSILNNCFSGYTYNQNSDYFCAQMYCPTLDCYYTFECHETQLYNESFMAGVGMYYGHYYQNNFSPSGNLNLIYLNKDGIECGSSYILDVKDLKDASNIIIFPNPMFNFLNVTSENIIPNGKLIITEITGKKVIECTFTKNIQIDVSNFSSGMYLIQIYSNGTIIHLNKLIK